MIPGYIYLPLAASGLWDSDSGNMTLVTQNLLSRGSGHSRIRVCPSSAPRHPSAASGPARQGWPGSAARRRRPGGLGGLGYGSHHHTVLDPSDAGSESHQSPGPLLPGRPSPRPSPTSDSDAIPERARARRGAGTGPDRARARRGAGGGRGAASQWGAPPLSLS
jgi:hypothetical protein